MIYRFGDFALDPDARSLRRSGRDIDIEPKVLDLLIYLIEARPRVALRSEIGDVLWPGTTVTRDALNRLAMEARRVVGDNGGSQDVIRTVRGRGYAFVADAFVESRLSASESATALHAAADGFPHGLSAEAIRLLRIAAAIGAEFTTTLLAHAAARPLRGCRAAVREAVGAGVLVGQRRDQLAFAEEETRRALYASLVSKPRELALAHLAIAEELEREGGEAHVAAELAYHFEQSAAVGGAGRAMVYCVKAAELATNRLAHDRATTYLERALALSRLASPFDEHLVADVMLRLARSSLHSHGLVAARAMYLEAIQLGRESHDTVLLGHAALGYADRQAVGDDDVISLLEDARADVDGAEPGSPMSIVLKARLASALPNHDSRRAHVLMAEAERDARDSGEPWVLAHTLEDSARVGLSADDPEAWIELNLEVCSAAREAGELEVEFHGAHGVASGHLEIGDIDAVRRDADILDEISHRLRTPMARGVTRGVRTMLALLAGRFDTARVGIEVSLEEADVFRHPDLVAQIYAQLYHLSREYGNLPVLARALDELAQRNPETMGFGAALLGIRIAEGGGSELLPQLQKLIDDLDDLSRDRQWLFVLSMIADACVSLGAATEAGRLYERMKPYGGLTDRRRILRPLLWRGRSLPRAAFALSRRP